MDKLKRKQSMFWILKTIAYFVGFPLMMVVVLIGSNQFMHYDLFNKTWFLGLLIVAIPWFLASVMQIVFGWFVKNQNVKTIAVTLVVGVVMIGSALVIDGYGKGVIDNAKESYSDSKYVSAGVNIDDYKYQVNWYVTLTTEDSLLDKFKVRTERFASVYNLEQVGFTWSDINVDGSATIPKSTEKGLGLKNVTVSKNGLLCDGWIFGLQEALDILIAYNEINDKATALGIDLESEYDTIIAKVEASPEYVDYTSEPEYIAAYGENGTANDHMITEERLNSMLPVVAKYLSVAVYDIANIMGDISYGLINSYININDLSNITTVDELITYVNNAIPNIATLLDGFVGAENNPLRDGSGYLQITKPFVMDLVKEMTYYYSPTVRPIFDFIAEATDGSGVLVCEYRDSEDNVILTAQEVQRFAYARYYAKIHGANIGSILIGENLGSVTMTSSGYPSDRFAYSLPELYQMDADLSYVPQLYPILAARRYLYVFAGICVLAIILFYHFDKKEDDIINEIIISKGGAR